MDYSDAIVVPFTATIQVPERKVVKVCPGVVKHVWLFFPKGHKGTTKIWILRHEHQVWPTNLDGYYLGDGTVIEFDENYPIVNPPFEFILVGYNTSTLHPHTAYCRFTILPTEKVIIPLPPRRVDIF